MLFALFTPTDFAMINLKEFEFRKHPVAGWQATSNYDNGFGISVIPEGDGESYELAVFRGGKLCYDSGITDDVLRFLSVDQVHQVALRVRNLKEGSRVTEPHPFVTSY